MTALNSATVPRTIKELSDLYAKEHWFNFGVHSSTRSCYEHALDVYAVFHDALGQSGSLFPYGRAVSDWERDWAGKVAYYALKLRSEIAASRG